MIVRESPNELTLRAEEVGALKAHVNDVDHSEEERWGPPLVDYDWYAFCQALYEGTEGEDWDDMFDSYKEISRAVGSEEAGGPKKQEPYGKCRQPRMQENNTTTPRVRKASKEETRQE